MADLRRPFLIAALILIALAVAVELGADIVLPKPSASPTALAALLADDDLRAAYLELDPDEVDAALNRDKPPGLGVGSLALMDGILLFHVGLMGLALLLGPARYGRVQGLLTLVVGLLLLLAALGLILVVALPRLLLMVALFLSTPFGTLAYLAVYGFFNRGGAAILLGAVMALRVGSVVCLVLAQPRMLQNKGLVGMTLTAFAATVVVSLLHGFVPIILVSIADAVAAIVAAALAAVWAVVMLVFAVSAVVKALKPS